MNSKVNMNNATHSPRLFVCLHTKLKEIVFTVHVFM